jgi:Uma2 family endonuclease
MATATQPKPTTLKETIYPTRDGRPMGETDKHRELMAYLIAALKVYFADQPNVYVSGNNFVFWEKGRPKSRISPDTYVVFGAEMRLRDSYMAWKEGGLLPGVVFEVTSRHTQGEDVKTKLPLYEQVLKTPEYFLFDPTGDYLRPRLQGYRLENGRYVRLELANDRLHSEQLGLDLVQEGERLRLFDPATDRFLMTAQEAIQFADKEFRRAEDAEAELARLRAEIEVLRARTGGDN